MVGNRKVEDMIYTSWKQEGVRYAPTRSSEPLLNAMDKQYELGQKDSGDLAFRFRYRSAAEKAQYTAMRALETAGTDVSWKATLKDGATMEFTGTCTTRLLTAGGPDTPVDWQLTIGLSSDFTFTPAS